MQFNPLVSAYHIHRFATCKAVAVHSDVFETNIFCQTLFQLQIKMHMQLLVYACNDIQLRMVGLKKKM